MKYIVYLIKALCSVFQNSCRRSGKGVVSDVCVPGRCGHVQRCVRTRLRHSLWLHETGPFWWHRLSHNTSTQCVVCKAFVRLRRQRRWKVKVTGDQTRTCHDKTVIGVCTKVWQQLYYFYVLFCLAGILHCIHPWGLWMQNTHFLTKYCMVQMTPPCSGAPLTYPTLYLMWSD